MTALQCHLQEGEPPPLPRETEPYSIHPLFPLPEGVRETKEIYQISFDRWDHQGRKERCPDRFLASDLTSLAQVIDRFGGGTYQFFSFDRRGNYARWTAEKDKVRVALPCKPLHQDHASGTAQKPAPPAPTPAPPDPLISLLIAWQERTDRILMALLARLTAPHPAPAPAPAPAPTLAPTSPATDPMAMMITLATMLEELQRPRGDAAGQLTELTRLLGEMNGIAPPATATATATTTGPTPSSTSTGLVAPPPMPPGLVWVDLPRIGPAMMRPDQAAAFTRLLAGQAAPTPAPVPQASVQPSTPGMAVWTPPPHRPVPTSTPLTASQEDVVAPLKDPAQQRALKAALARAIAARPSSPKPPPAPAPVPVSAPGPRRVPHVPEGADAAPCAPAAAPTPTPPPHAARPPAERLPSPAVGGAQDWPSFRPQSPSGTQPTTDGSDVVQNALSENGPGFPPGLPF